MSAPPAGVALPPVGPGDFINPSHDTTGWWMAFAQGGWAWRWFSTPRLYFRPGLEYFVGGSFQVIDPMSRCRTYNRIFDSVFNPQTGRLETLYVQSTDSLCYASRSRPNSTWKRTVMRNVAPMYLRVANLPFRPIPGNRRNDSTLYTPEDYAWIALLWIPTAALMFPAVSILGFNIWD